MKKVNFEHLRNKFRDFHESHSGILLFLYISFFVVGFIWVNNYNEKVRTDRKNLIATGDFAIGIFEYSTYSKEANATYANFYFKVGTTKYRGSDSNYHLDFNEANDVLDKAKDGDRFLIIYKKNYPKKAIIRLDFPIKDSVDFKKCVHVFNELRQQNKSK